MTKRARRRAWLAALWTAAFGFGCGSGDPAGEQVLTGRVDTTSGVVAIRAVVGTQVVTAAQVASDGTFRIALPSGARYRLEVLTTGGVKPVLEHVDDSWKGLEFQVCTPTDPFDVGTIAEHSGGMCDPMDPNCKDPCDDEPPPPCSDPMDPGCDCTADGSCPPPPCMDPMDPNCQPPKCGGPNEPPCPDPDPCTDPMSPNCPPPPTCGGPNEPPCPDPCTTNPMDPSCPPPPSCGGPNEPPCPDPEPCMDPSDPWCACKLDGTCPPPDPCMDPMDPNCGQQCTDPMDPTTCQDPCVTDPMQCGCPPGDPNCWPPPEPPTCMEGGTCDPGDDPMAPANAPGDFGCKWEVLDK
jgi:hypothetical protein